MPKINQKYEKKNPTIGETNNLPSMTIEGQAWSIRDLLKKHQAGNMPDIERDPIWGEDNPTFDGPDLQSLSNLDISEKQEHLNTIKEVIRSAESSLEDSKSAGKPAPQSENPLADSTKGQAVQPSEAGERAPTNQRPKQ